MTQHKIDPHVHKELLDKAAGYTKPKEEKKQETKPETLNKIIYILIASLVILALIIAIKEHYTIPKVYKYSNGQSEFEVRRISDTQSEIIFYRDNNPQPFSMPLRYGPLELKGLEIEDKTIRNKIQNDELVYITIDPKEELKNEAALAMLEIGKYISNKYFSFNIPVQNVVTSKYDNNTIVTCANATDTNTVIWVKRGSETKIKSEGNCILVEGKTETDMVKAADRLALHLVGIMP